MNDSSKRDSSLAALISIEVAIRLGLLLILVAWCFMIVSPFVLPVMWGIIIAVVD